MNNHKITIIAAITGTLALSILAIVSLSINQGFASTFCPTNVMVSLDPDEGTVDSSGFLVVSVSAQLDSANVCNFPFTETVTYTVIGDDSKTVKTDDKSGFGPTFRLPQAHIQLKQI